MLKKALLLFISFLSVAAFAQDKNLKGKVSDESNLPIPGVTVVVKGTTVGTVTDADGNYFINVANGQEIVFSLIGMITQTVTYTNQSTLDITLADDQKLLEEVVVIGYQTIRKKDLTGAVSVINTENTSKISANNLAQSLQGTSPGVTVRNGGGPAGGAEIEIRGAASFVNTSPLYVIDGMIADANFTINTSDVESIQVLKDASAAAIYGSRAANGVIIVTTKKGKIGPAKLTFSAKYGIQDIAKRYDVMNAEEYAAMKSQAYLNAGNNPPANISSARNPNIDTDWQNELFRTGAQQDYSVSLSGGSESARYMVSSNLFNNEGTLIANSFNRASFRINSEIKKGRLTFGENIVLTQSKVRNPAEGNAFFDAPTMLPTISVQSDDLITALNPGGYGYGTTEMPTYRYNYAAIADINPRVSRYSKIVGNAYADLKLTDWLNYRFNAGLEASFDQINSLRKPGSWHFTQQVYPSSTSETRGRFASILLEHTLNFNKTFGKHNVNGVVGISNQHTQNSFINAQRLGLQQQNGQYFTTIISASGEPAVEGAITDDYRIFGYLGRINYNYDDRYLATFTGRLDQDSRFAEDYRNAFFPSVSAAWRISKESFFNVDWIDDLKINASYGELGIVTVGSWDYQGLINPAPRAVFGPGPIQGSYVGAYQARLSNPDLRWENRIIKNFGLEGRLFKNVTFSFAAYNSLSEDALIYFKLPGYLGNLAGDPAVNSASVRNTGVELELGYGDNSKEFKWNVSGNLTTIKNRVLALGNLGKGIDYIPAGDTRSKIGRSMGEWFVLQTDGLFQSIEEISNYTNSEGKIIQPDARPGDIRYKDLDDNGLINNDDRDYNGSPWPTLQTGLQFNGSYKNFSLNLQFVGIFGSTVYNAIKRDLDGYNLTNFRKDLNPWSPTNTNTTDPRIGIFANETPVDVGSSRGLVDNALGNTNRWLEDGSYVRLRNIQLGYQLPKSLLTRISVDNAMVYVSGQNLFTVTNYSGYDPDLTGVGILERGLDSGNWPSPRIVSFGVQFGF